MRPTTALAQDPLFQLRTDNLPWKARVGISYQRARAIAKAYELTAEDVRCVSARYWQFHTDPLLAVDGSVGTLLTIHFNLCIGTVAMFVSERPDLAESLDQLLRFELSGQYCLTELGHGLDALNLETTATLQSDGTFLLHTPLERAAKYMPPTVPSGIPCISVVFARLIVGTEDRGIKPFLVPLHDGKRMHAGISTRLLSPRGGSRPVEHALTYFRHVRLPQSALLGKIHRDEDVKATFFHNISRVISGTLCMGTLGINGMRMAAFIAAKYSQRRTVWDAFKRSPRPIISFSTQYLPILTGIAQTYVMDAFGHASRERFAGAQDLVMRHFAAAVFKTTVMKLASEVIYGLGDRCGAQGLFEVNQLSVMLPELRGAAIAEGDTLAISIRFTVDVLLGRIDVPPSDNPTSLLAKRECAILDELRSFVQEAAGHRDARTESLILPHCQELIQSIGFRFAYDDAVARGVQPQLLDLFVASVLTYSEAWYMESEGLSRWDQRTKLIEAANALYPQLDSLLEHWEIGQYVTAPIVSEKKWDAYVQSLEVEGDAIDFTTRTGGGYGNHSGVVEFAARARL